MTDSLVEQIELLRLPKKEYSIAFAHHRGEAISQRAIIARLMAKDNLERDPFKQMIELIPSHILACIGREQFGRLINCDEELTSLRMNTLAGRQHCLVELSPIPPFGATRDSSRIRLEVRHAPPLEV